MAEPGPCLVLSCVNIHSQQHVLVMCATAFYLIENYPLDVGPEFSASIIQASGNGRGLRAPGPVQRGPWWFSSGGRCMSDRRPDVAL